MRINYKCCNCDNRVHKEGLKCNRCTLEHYEALYGPRNRAIDEHERNCHACNPPRYWYCTNCGNDDDICDCRPACNISRASWLASAEYKAFIVEQNDLGISRRESSYNNDAYWDWKYKQLLQDERE